ncbi:MAG: hypothetical protein CMC13_00435 [Flavobacteriaceae bacterium]|nr:hypothetical protein [Flavobacteriaceae bacterium]|tara:strand:- start:16 stop:810 length:795 start_codon:yes stop_codon:yes gene_type:complete
MVEIEINDWKKLSVYLEKIFINLKDLSNGYVHFRGQSDKQWKLEPSLTRIVLGDEISEKKAEYYEKQSILNFRSQFHLLNDKISYNPENHNISVLIDMQHYSCPTRLLDWTTSPYVALYFAVRESFEKDGALFIWTIPQYKKNLKEKYKDNDSIDITDLIDFKDYDYAEIVYSTRKNERIVKQQGTFSISNNLLKSHCDLITNIAQEQNQNSGLIKLIIKNDIKVEFLARLKTMNISSESLFPGLDGLGRSVRESLMIRKWKRE